MKPSTRQRFMAMSFDYPTAETEAKIVAQESGAPIEQVQQLVQLGQSLRNLKDHDLEEAASTRLLIYAAKLIVSGIDMKQACYAAMAEPLSDDEATVAALKTVIDACVVD
jgi:nitric oxide reductase NorQ protein